MRLFSFYAEARRKWNARFGPGHFTPNTSQVVCVKSSWKEGCSFCVWLFIRRSARVVSDDSLHILQMKSTQTFISCTDAVMRMHRQRLKNNSQFPNRRHPSRSVIPQRTSAIERSRIIHHWYQRAWRTTTRSWPRRLRSVKRSRGARVSRNSRPECRSLCCTVRSLTKLNATVPSQLPAGTARLTAKRYKVFPIRISNRSRKTKKSTSVSCSSSSGSREVTLHSALSVNALYLRIDASLKQCCATGVPRIFIRNCLFAHYS
jgi:hypothetical protein